MKKLLAIVVSFLLVSTMVVLADAKVAPAPLVKHGIIRIAPEAGSPSGSGGGGTTYGAFKKYLRIVEPDSWLQCNEKKADGYVSSSKKGKCLKKLFRERINEDGRFLSTAEIKKLINPDLE